jgi:hypothetical protein
MMAGEEDLERTEVEAVADRIEAAVAARAAHDVAARGHDDRRSDAAGPRQLTLGIVSCVAGIPVTAISLAVEGGVTGLVAMMVGWGGLVGVNTAHALQARPSRPVHRVH